MRGDHHEDLQAREDRRDLRQNGESGKSGNPGEPAQRGFLQSPGKGVGRLRRGPHLPVERPDDVDDDANLKLGDFRRHLFISLLEERIKLDLSCVLKSHEICFARLCHGIGVTWSQSYRQDSALQAKTRQLFIPA